MEANEEKNEWPGQAGVTRKIEEYRLLRSAFCRVLEGNLRDQLDLEIKAMGFDPDLLSEAMSWPERRVQWNWFSVWRKYWNKPARLELAILANDKLCALLLGKPSKGRRHLSLYYLEANPDTNNPIKGKVVKIVADAALLYATLLGCSVVRVVAPLPAVTPLYEAGGFRLASKEGVSPVYLEQSVERSKA